MSSPSAAVPESGAAGEHPPIPPLRFPQSLLLSCAGLGVGMIFAFFNAQLPLYLHNYNVPSQWIGPLTNERSFAGAIVLPLVGRLSDRIHTRWGKRRPFFLVGVPLLAVALVVMGLHPPVEIMLTTVFLAGGFLFIALGPYQTLMADITPSEQRGRVSSAVALAGLAGAVLVSVLAGTLWDEHRDVVFFATAAILVLSFAVTFLTVREPAHHFASAARSKPAPPPAARVGGRVYLRDLRRYHQLVRYSAAMSLYWLAAGGATPFITLFGTQTLGLSGDAASTLFLVLVLSTAAGTVGVGVLADRVGKKRVLHAGLGLFVLAALAATAVQDAWQAVPVLVVAGLGNACPTVLSVPILADLAPRRRAGEFIGLGSFVWSVVQPLGAFCAGALVEITHSTRWAFGFAGVVMALAVLALFAVAPDPTIPLDDGALAPAA